MDGRIKYEFSANLWKHDAPGGWHFVSLPLTLSKEIRVNLKWQEEGWGRMKAAARIGGTNWETAIWYDTKRNTYILPIKAEIRRKCNLKENQTVQITLII